MRRPVTRCGRSRSAIPSGAASRDRGDVVFYGTLDGWFKAVDARPGVLWKFKVGSGVVGSPITYRGPDGKQYVAVYAGIGGDWFLLSGDVRTDDPADVRDPRDFARDLARHTSQGGIVWIFALDPELVLALALRGLYRCAKQDAAAPHAPSLRAQRPHFRRRRPAARSPSPTPARECADAGEGAKLFSR